MNIQLFKGKKNKSAGQGGGGKFLKSLKKWAIRAAIIIGIAAIFVGVPYIMPDYLKVSRSFRVNRDINTVTRFALDLNNWEYWNPQHEDEMKYTVTKILENNVNKVSWAAPKLAQGQLSTDSLAIDTVTNIRSWYMTINSYAPEKWEYPTRMEFKESAGATIVTWEYFDSLSYPFGRIKGFLIKSKIGEYFETALFKLRDKIEIEQTEPKSYVKYEFITTRELFLYTIKDSTDTPENVATKLGECFGELNRFFLNDSIEMSAPPIVVNYEYDAKDDNYIFAVAMPVDSFTSLGIGRINKMTIPSTQALLAAHWGPYDQVKKLYEEAYKIISEKGYKPINNSWEQYISDPQIVLPEEIETHIYIPVTPLDSMAIVTTVIDSTKTNE